MPALHDHHPLLHAHLQLVRLVIRGVQRHLQLLIIVPHPDDLAVPLTEEVEIAQEVGAGGEAGPH
ncbi:MAG: hypothetical protein ACK56F_05880, partial [bacterium]